MIRTILLLVALLLPTAAHTEDRRPPLPVPSTTGACPNGYSFSPTSRMCVPGPNTTQRAVPKRGYGSCPPGWHESPTSQTCVENGK